MRTTPKAETGRPYNLIGGTLTLTNVSRARAYRNANQAIANNAWTPLGIDTIDYDTRGEMSLVTGQFTADEPGYYFINTKGILSSVSFTAGEKFVLALYLNGAELCRQNQFIQVTGNRFESAIITDVFYLAAGDTIRTWIYHNSGVNDGIFYGTTNNCLIVHRLS